MVAAEREVQSAEKAEVSADTTGKQERGKKKGAKERKGGKEREGEGRHRRETWEAEGTKSRSERIWTTIETTDERHRSSDTLCNVPPSLLA